MVSCDRVGTFFVPAKAVPERVLWMWLEFTLERRLSAAGTVADVSAGPTSAGD